MFCKKCGAELQNDSAFCTNCGASVQAPAPVPAASSVPVQPIPPSTNHPGKRIAGMVLGIHGMVFGIIGCVFAATVYGILVGGVIALVGLVCSIVGTTLSKGAGCVNKFAKAGLITSIIPLALATLVPILYVLYMVVVYVGMYLVMLFSMIASA